MARVKKETIGEDNKKHQHGAICRQFIMPCILRRGQSTRLCLVKLSSCPWLLLAYHSSLPGPLCGHAFLVCKSMHCLPNIHTHPIALCASSTQACVCLPSFALSDRVPFQPIDSHPTGIYQNFRGEPALAPLPVLSLVIGHHNPTAFYYYNILHVKEHATFVGSQVDVFERQESCWLS